VVCSACGFKNEPNMRFCGMCGIPLPSRPMTTPGGQSTLNLTRVPVESGTATQETSPISARSHELVSGHGRASTVADSAMADSATPVAEALPAKELVPDVPLDEYLQNFRYEPPRNPDEVTMRGDAAPSPDVEAPAPPPSAQRITPPDVRPQMSASGRPVVVARSNIEPERPVIEQVRPSVPEDTVSRLGIEPEAPEEERIQRPRFLDINEPTKESVRATGPGTSTIVGPSFLGLSDAPHIAADSLPPDVDEPGHTSHWRAWVAVAILAVFVVLGVVQWRAQTGNSPLQVIKAKLYGLRHGNSQRASNQSAPADPLAADTIPKAETPTQQPVPQAIAPAATNAPSPTAPAATPTRSQQSAPAATQRPPATTQASPPPAASGNANTSVTPQSPPTIDNSQTATAATEKPPAKTVTETAAAQPENATPPSPKPKRSADDTANQPRSKQGIAGADEMAKAKDASDAAASAAWLWKATAKGNPEAPVQLADMYIKGSGVPRSCEQAVVLLKTAAEKENALARNRLASMYATGNCVQRNRVEAYRWLSAALVANPQSQWAQQNRDIIWNQMTPDEQAVAQKYR
jgi:Sel1 repeat-containing protein